MDSTPPWRQLLAELKRRRVYRVAAVYATTAFVTVQVADLTFERLTLPPWTVTLVIVLALVGFPIAVVLAWAYEMTPDGMRRTADPRSAGSRLPAGEGGEAGAPAPAGSDAGERLRPPVRTGTVLALATGLALVAGGGWWLYGSAAGSGPAIDRLAVLPLANLMDDPDQAYFVQGMHDRLIAELQEAGVSVIARTSVMPFSDGRTPARQIARQLDVDALVEGTVYRAGDSVAIEARLVDPTTEEYLWRRSFGASLGNVVGLHRDLTAAIAGEIRAALAPEAEARLAGAPSVDPEAFEAYLRGEFHLQRFTPEDFTAALDYYGRALAIDSTYAPAHLGVARVWGYRAQATLLTGVSNEQARQHWKPALERALALDSTLASAHALRGSSLAWNEWRFAEGREAMRRALELNPGLARQRMFYAHLLTILGEWEEARRHAERALELDPLNPFLQGLYGVHLNLTRRSEEAVAVLEEMFRKHPDAGFGRSALARAYERTGRYEDALRLEKDLARRRGEAYLVPVLDRGHRAGGYRAALARAADTMAARARAGERGPAGIAPRYAAAGRPEAALDWMERVVETRNPNSPYFGVAPQFEVLHDHPRFRALMDRIGVPILTAPAGP